MTFLNALSLGRVVKRLLTLLALLLGLLQLPLNRLTLGLALLDLLLLDSGSCRRAAHGFDATPSQQAAQQCCCDAGSQHER
jgi:hypothetical protein